MMIEKICVALLGILFAWIAFNLLVTVWLALKFLVLVLWTL